ncbi:hypothetical protein B566_EDAN009500 [Ephemera danica]|nr:hypothetical protein B566_EDAN009500 [Ephemera danica]
MLNHSLINFKMFGTTHSSGSDSPYSQQNVRPLSPYLNIDPNLLRTHQPEFIFPEGASRQRGRFELAFSQIGGSCIAGVSVGGATGLYRGMRQATLAGYTGKLMRTQ